MHLHKKIADFNLNDLTRKPLVSVCMLTYNHENYIHESLDSVLMQKVNFPVEVLVHDDASTDKTQAILTNYDQKHPGLFNMLLQTENQRSIYGSGMNPRFNYPRARGKYIALCEGDDYWTDPLKLQKQVDFLEANPDYVGCFHNVNYIDERKKDAIERPWRVYERDIYTAEDTIREFSLFHTSSYLFRASAYQKIPFNSSKISSGDMLVLSIIAKHGKLKLLEGCMSVYRKNEGGVTSSESLLKYHENRIHLNKVLNKYHEYKFKAKAKRIIAYHKDEYFKLKYPRLSKIKTKLENKIKKLKPSFL